MGINLLFLLGGFIFSSGFFLWWMNKKQNLDQLQIIELETFLSMERKKNQVDKQQIQELQKKNPKYMAVFWIQFTIK